MNIPLNLNQLCTFFFNFLSKQVGNKMVKLKRRLTLEDGFQIAKVGRRFVQVISTKCNINVIFDGRHMVNVMVPKRYKNKMSGICGNCDGIKNDLKTAGGKDVSDKPRKMYRMIGDSHKKEEWGMPFLKDKLWVGWIQDITPLFECV